MTDYRIQDDHCPCCGEHLDHASGSGGAPQPGDFTVCIYCAEPLCFDDKLKIRHATLTDMLDAGAETRAEISRVQSAIRLSRLIERHHRATPEPFDGGPDPEPDPD